MKKLICLFALVMLVSGCATAPFGDKVFKYEVASISVKPKIEKTVGLNIMVDNLPSKDREYAKKVTGVMDKMTAKFLEDFDKSKIFKDIHLGVKSDDDIIINGTANRFFWEYTQNPKAWIPLVGPFIGPLWRTNGVVGISLEIQDNKTGGVINSFQESSEFKGKYGSFDTANLIAQSELTDAFKDVVNKLKKDIIANFNSPQIINSADEIRKYKELLDSGAITKEEYEQKKKQLLGL